MPGQVWARATDGAYLYADNSSKTLRAELAHSCKFRQMCDAKDIDDEAELHRGDTFTWQRYSSLNRQGYRLAEDQPMPEAQFKVGKGSLTIVEYGNSVPYTGKLSSMAQWQIDEIIDKVLARDAKQCFDIEAFLAFSKTPLRASPASGTDTKAIELAENGSAPQTNNVALRKGHVRNIATTMAGRDIPGFGGTEDYVALSRLEALDDVRDDLESVKQYTETGLGMIFSGEIGKYDNVRFVTQTFIPEGGANDSTTYDPLTRTGDAWNNGKSDWVFFMGDDTVAEALPIPEEVRGMLATDFGRSHRIAWYALGGMEIVHSDPAQARIVMWDSAA
jgi:N4-gp56 family major capsid protein